MSIVWGIRPIRRKTPRPKWKEKVAQLLWPQDNHNCVCICVCVCVGQGVCVAIVHCSKGPTFIASVATRRHLIAAGWAMKQVVRERRRCLHSSLLGLCRHFAAILLCMAIKHARQIKIGNKHKFVARKSTVGRSFSYHMNMCPELGPSAKK